MRLFPEHAEEKIVISIITPAVISSAVENHFNITSIAEVDIYVKFQVRVKITISYRIDLLNKLINLIGRFF